MQKMREQFEKFRESFARGPSGFRGPDAAGRSGDNRGRGPSPWGGFNPQTDALLEIAAVFVEMRSDGTLVRGETIRYHVKPFPGANMEPASLAVNGIDPHHPLRPAITEEDALQRIFREVRNAIRTTDCTRAVLVGHYYGGGVARAAVGLAPHGSRRWSCWRAWAQDV